MFPSDNTSKPNFNMGSFENLLVKAFFNYKGGWGRPPKSFILYITPGGVIRGIKSDMYVTSSDHPFKEGQKVSLSDLIGFENDSLFDLRMKGRIREGKLNEEEDNTHHIISYMEKVKPHYKLLDDYIKLRVYFKNQGYSEEDLKNVKRAPSWVWNIQTSFPLRVEKIKNDLIKIGILKFSGYPEGDDKILMDYLTDEMKKIDEQFPMNPPETSYVPPIMKDGSHMI